MLHDGKFEIKLGLPSGTSFPTDPAPEEGDIFYRTDEDKVYTYDGATWNELGGGGGATFNDAGGDPADLDIPEADGTSTYAARRDHVHRSRIDRGTSFPGNPAEGDIFYRTDEDKVYVYDGTTWDQIGGGSGTSPVSATASATAATTKNDNTWADLITVSLTTSNQGNIEVHATVRVRYTTSNWRHFAFRLRVGTTYSTAFVEQIDANANTTKYSLIHLHWLFTSIAAGALTVGLQWRNNGTGGTMEATARAITAIGLAG